MKTAKVLNPLLLTAGVGALMMYFLDPERGKMRRDRMRTQARRRVASLTETVDAVKTGLQERATDVIERGRETFEHGRVALETRAQLAADHSLEKAVVKHLKRSVQHPERIAVGAHDGVVTLRGPLRRNEAHRLMQRLATLEGLREVDDQLEIVGSRSGRQRARRRSWVMPLATTLGGGLLWWYGRRSTGPVSAFAKVAGMGMAARGLKQF